MRTKNITAAIATIGLLVMTSCGGSSDQAESYQAPDIAVLTTSFSPADHELSFPAILQGKTDIEIRPQVTGFIIKVHVYEGQVVKKGQPLFTIDQVQYKAAVSQAAANVSAAKTEVNKAKLTVQNKRRLFEKDIISAFEMEIAESDLKNAQSMLVNAQASLASAQQNLDYTVVKAPSNGVVGKLPLREGSLASPSNPEPLTTVSDNSQIYVIFSVTEKDLLYLSENGKVSLNEAIKMAPPVKLQTADGSVYPVEGKIETISGLIDNATGAASVRAIFNNPAGILRSGGTGNLVIPIHLDSVIVIPQKATFELQDRRMVYVLGDSNKLATRVVKVEPLKGGQDFVVQEGLKVGEVIAVEGVGSTIGDGSIINPIDAAAKANEAQQAEAEQK